MMTRRELIAAGAVAADSAVLLSDMKNVEAAGYMIMGHAGMGDEVEMAVPRNSIPMVGG